MGAPPVAEEATRASGRGRQKRKAFQSRRCCRAPQQEANARPWESVFEGYGLPRLLSQARNDGDLFSRVISAFALLLLPPLQRLRRQLRKQTEYR